MRDVAFAVYFSFAFGIGAFWAFVIGSVVSAFGYPVAFTLMAASYAGAAGLLLAVPTLQSERSTAVRDERRR